MDLSNENVRVTKSNNSPAGEIKHAYIDLTAVEGVLEDGKDLSTVILKCGERVIVKGEADVISKQVDDAKRGLID